MFAAVLDNCRSRFAIGHINGCSNCKASGSRRSRICEKWWKIAEGSSRPAGPTICPQSGWRATVRFRSRPAGGRAAQRRGTIMCAIVDAGVVIRDPVPLIKFFECRHPTLPAMNRLADRISPQTEDPRDSQDIAPLSDEKKRSAASSQLTGRYSARTRAARASLSKASSR